LSLSLSDFIDHETRDAAPVLCESEALNPVPKEYDRMKIPHDSPGSTSQPQIQAGLLHHDIQSAQNDANDDICSTRIDGAMPA
jgi:hypothetical protein